jgi:hypothetical protein
MEKRLNKIRKNTTRIKSWKQESIKATELRLTVKCRKGGK